MDHFRQVEQHFYGAVMKKTVFLSVIGLMFSAHLSFATDLSLEAKQRIQLAKGYVMAVNSTEGQVSRVRVVKNEDLSMTASYVTIGYTMKYNDERGTKNLTDVIMVKKGLPDTYDDGLDAGYMLQTLESK